MASITLQISLAGPTDNAGTCRVLYQVVDAVGLAPEIFVIKYWAPAYKGAEPQQQWQHVAYADEMTNLPTQPVEGQVSLVRKPSAMVQYNSLDAAKVAIRSIRSQVQRLVNEIDVLDEYSETKTFVISSID